MKDNSAALAADLVSAYVMNNKLSAAEFQDFVAATFSTVANLTSDTPGPAKTEPPRPNPAVPIAKSVTPDYLICLEDGKRYQVLTGHLRALGFTPDQYRRKWGLLHDYPMVSPNYRDKRSKIAKSLGLGVKKALKPVEPEPIVAVPPEPPAPPPSPPPIAEVSRIKATIDLATVPQPFVDEALSKPPVGSPPLPKKPETALANALEAAAKANPRAAMNIPAPAPPARVARKSHDKSDVVVVKKKNRSGNLKAAPVSSRKGAFNGGNGASKS